MRCELKTLIDHDLCADRHVDTDRTILQRTHDDIIECVDAFDYGDFVLFQADGLCQLGSAPILLVEGAYAILLSVYDPWGCAHARRREQNEKKRERGRRFRPA